MNNVFSNLLAIIFMLTALIPSISEAAKRGKLAKILSPDMLSVDLAYFEQVSGIARNTYDKTKIYSIDGCEVTATIEDSSVHALRVDLSNKCTFDLNDFIPLTSGKFPAPQNLTFGLFDKLEGDDGVFMADCLYLCGNAADPVVFEHWQGPHSLNNIEVMLEAVQVGDAVIDAANIWEEAMKKDKGADWVMYAKFNCEPEKYNSIAHKAFKNIKITAITIGRNIIKPTCN
jgi:hypothetical protein